MPEMRKQEHMFSQKKVDYLFDADLKNIIAAQPAGKTVIITDEQVYLHHAAKFDGLPVIKLQGGEINKQQHTIDDVISQLLEMQADKQTCIIGVGGGVVSDMAGYTASIYKRGVRLILAPTSILGMVDAAVGGKNGVNAGKYKNMVGTVYQPDTIVFDYSFLDTLPEEEWVNGFAEIIKHACIKDAELFRFLSGKTLVAFRADKALMSALIEKNVAIKTSIVLEDEFETGDRKLLNFGHTLGHAIENIHGLPHGHAISIGMVAAAAISEEINGFHPEEKAALVRLLQQYGLPVQLQLNKDRIWELLLMDKKRDNGVMHFILLDKIGKGIIRAVPLVQLKELLAQYL
jgi:3-dehydroquinate synthase